MPTVTHDDMMDALVFGSRLKRLPDITFKTQDPKIIARVQKQFALGEAFNVNFAGVRGYVGGYRGKAFVTAWKPTYFPDRDHGRLECEVTLRPTGAPKRVGADALRIAAEDIMRDSMRRTPIDTGALHCSVDYGTKPGRVLVTNLPASPAGVVARHLYGGPAEPYGKPFTQTIIDELAKHPIPLYELRGQSVRDRIRDNFRTHFGMDIGTKPSVVYDAIYRHPRWPTRELQGKHENFYIADDVMGEPFWYRRFDGELVTFNYEPTIKFDGLSVTEALDKITKHVGMDLESTLINGHLNCRCTPVGITSTPKKEKRMKIRNKFYVAAPSVTTVSEQVQDNVSGKVHLSTSPSDRSGKWTRRDLADALTHGEKMLADNPNLEHVAIVKIVKIVRRPKPRYLHEDVK